MGVLAIEEALKRAKESGLDLVEISPTANPPVARIIDKGKYFYEQEKKERQAQKRRKEVEVKNIRLSIGTGTHDLELKAKQADKFLKDGDKIKIDLMLKGREKYLKRDFLQERLKRILGIISSAFIEEAIKAGPRSISITISPKK